MRLVMKIYEMGYEEIYFCEMDIEDIYFQMIFGLLDQKEYFYIQNFYYYKYREFRNEFYVFRLNRFVVIYIDLYEV